MDESPRYLSSNIGELEPHYSIVVVGSGYGGAIAASRLARAGQQVCLLERGREILPGDYPNTLSKAYDEFQVDDEDGHRGKDNGLYDVRFNHDLGVVLGCGLGGTSLINAGVFKAAVDEVFTDTRWPPELRTPGVLRDYYGHAADMLKPSPYPANRPPLPKIEAMRKVAHALDLEKKFEVTPVNVNFTVDGENHVGVTQRPCEFCGDCISGCNYHAKNTLLMNYLPDAWNHGARLFTEIEVRHLEWRDEEQRWVLHLRDRRATIKQLQQARSDLSADIVVLGAGALGSTEILARSKRKGLSLSNQVGKRFTGNGDFLAFGIRMKPEVRGIGFDGWRPEDRDDVGTNISTLIDGRATPDFNDGFVFEEGVIPGALASLFGPWLTLRAAMKADPSDQNLVAEVKAIEEQGIRPDESFAGLWDHVITYLGMAHDSGRGEMALTPEPDDRLRISWPGVTHEPIFATMKEKLKNATKSVGGHFVHFPEWHDPPSQMTVHPLGGCVMGESAETGVVNQKGQVFNPGSRDAVHKGLYVCDGSVIPRPLGVNPLMTISAVAERSVALLAKDNGWTIDYTIRRPADPPGKLRPLGLRFHERMVGDYTPTASHLMATPPEAEFSLLVQWDDVAALFENIETPASLSGTVTLREISRDAMRVIEGSLSLLVKDRSRVNARKMLYDMVLEATDGTRYKFHGFKDIKDDPGPDIWSDTNTLFVTITDMSGVEVGKAVLGMRGDDWVRQQSSIEVPNARSRHEKRETVEKFLKLFLGALYEVYAGAWGRPVLYDPSAPMRHHRPLRLPVPVKHEVLTKDNFKVRLTRYNGGAKGPLIVSHGFGESSQSYLLDTIDTNFTEFMFKQGYDVWLLDWRGSTDLPGEPTQFTLDDVAKLDCPAAFQYVNTQTGGRGVQVMGHCCGSATLMMSLLLGLAPEVRSAVCSQFTVHVNQPFIQEAKAAAHLPDLLKAVGITSMTPSVNTETFHEIDQLLDTFLRVTSTHETCDSPVCRRVLLMFGEVFRHDQLNYDSHRAIHELFGLANITTFQHIARIVRHRQVVDAEGRDAYLPGVAKLESIPISILQGLGNNLFTPRGSERTYEWLRAANPSGRYRRVTVNDYGHQDFFIGRNASKDVYPQILAELEAYC